MAELFSAIGAPARIAGRAPLVSRYISSGFSTLRGSSPYAAARFGKSYRWRPWLLLDIKDLETLEELINTGSDTQIAAFRTSQLSVCGMIAIVGALVAQAGITALQLPQLDHIHYTCRGSFTMSLITSLLAVFFACLQQRTLGPAAESSAARAWLSNGVRYTSARAESSLQSSMVAHMILNAPFEIASMAITLFMVGLGLYLGLGMTAGVNLSTGTNDNRGVLIAFVIPTFFVLVMFGWMMGMKDLEEASYNLRSNFSGDGNAVDLSNERVSNSVRSGSAFATDVEDPAQLRRLRSSKSGQFSAVDGSGEGLRQALRDAAAAQRQCARANDEVARQYERFMDGHFSY